MTRTLTAARAVAGAHGITPTQVTELPGGVANRVFGLGPTLILRIPRSPTFAPDLHKEVAVIPVARAAGVQTPAVVANGTVAANDSTPYVLMERVDGNDLITWTAHPDQRAERKLWEQLGQEIGLLHRVPRNHLAGVPTDSGFGPGAVEELISRGFVDGATGTWLAEWMKALGEHFDHDRATVLLHGDLAPQNIVVNDDGQFAALIDWGDAAWGPRGMEFAKLRLEQVVQVLPAYKEVAGVEFAPGELEAEVLWFHLHWGVSNLMGPPRPGERHWTAAPASRVLGVLRFLATDPPQPWRGLIKKVGLWV